jgi:hypothetical protein
MTRPRLEPKIYRTRGKQAKHYSTRTRLEPKIYHTRGKQAKHYTRQRLEPKIYRTRGKQAKHYTTGAVDELYSLLLLHNTKGVVEKQETPMLKSLGIPDLEPNIYRPREASKLNITPPMRFIYNTEKTIMTVNTK